MIKTLKAYAIARVKALETLPSSTFPPSYFEGQKVAWTELLRFLEAYEYPKIIKGLFASRKGGKGS